MSSDRNLGWKTSNSAIYIGTYVPVWFSLCIRWEEWNLLSFLETTKHLHRGKKKKPKAVMHSRTYFLAFIFIEYEHVCTRILNCILPRAVYHFKSYCLRMTRSKKFLADVSL